MFPDNEYVLQKDANDKITKKSTTEINANIRNVLNTIDVKIEEMRSEFNQKFEKVTIDPITGNVTIEGPLEIKGNATIDGNTQVDGNFKANELMLNNQTLMDTFNSDDTYNRNEMNNVFVRYDQPFEIRNSDKPSDKITRVGSKIHLKDKVHNSYQGVDTAWKIVKVG